MVAWSAPSHYLNQCWNIVNWTLRNKLQWDLNRNSYIFINENAFQNVVWKLAVISSRPQRVKSYVLSYNEITWSTFSLYAVWKLNTKGWDIYFRRWSHIKNWCMQTQTNSNSWWRHQMETFSALLAICAGNSPVTGEFPAQRPVTRSFDVFFDLRLNKRLSKQSWGWWFETPPHPLWRHCNMFSNTKHNKLSPLLTVDAILSTNTSVTLR